jgi:hypothetical protein
MRRPEKKDESGSIQEKRAGVGEEAGETAVAAQSYITEW